MRILAPLFFSLVLLPAVSVGLGACGGGSDSGDSGGGGKAGSGASSSSGGVPLTPEEQMAKFCADVVKPYCQAFFACCTVDPGSIATMGGDEAGCEAKIAAECQGSMTDSILPHVKAGETALDEARLSACTSTLAAMNAGGAACTRVPSFVFLTDCFGAFVGKLAPGRAACDDTGLGDFSFVLCDKGDCRSGACEAFLPLGASCQNPNNAAGGCNYVNGEFCSVTGGVGTCVPVGKQGDKVCDLAVDPGFTCLSAWCDASSLHCISPNADRLCKLP